MNIKHNILGLTILTCAMASCTESRNKSEANKASNQIINKDSIKGCYLCTVNRDTFQLAIRKVEGENIEGSLLYNFAEKDDSKGNFKGTFAEGKLNGEYRFQAEGKESIRQVAFKKEGDGFVEGFGEVKEVDGMETFIDTSKISFTNGIKFTKMDTCLP
ncbi:hypothetical protein [Pedobacter jamesrossensis]|uniref:Uncharacterized protein n=1 Tax=Pedobacter jamesrossensis TaxID=1908238 RepID=A0ABV8NLX2_9SPHI